MKEHFDKLRCTYTHSSEPEELSVDESWVYEDEGEDEGVFTLYMSPPVLEQVRTCCPSESKAKSRPRGT